jgi:hypothetical protein
VPKFLVLKSPVQKFHCKWPLPHNMIGERKLHSSVWLAQFTRSCKPMPATWDKDVTFSSVYWQSGTILTMGNSRWSSLDISVPLLECTFKYLLSRRVVCMTNSCQLEYRF